MNTKKLWITSLCAILLATSPGTAAIVEISGFFGTTREITVAKDPGDVIYLDEFGNQQPFDPEAIGATLFPYYGYASFYNRIMQEEAPLYGVIPQIDPVLAASGQFVDDQGPHFEDFVLEGAWTFDDRAFDIDLASVTSDPSGTVIGETNLASIFTAFVGGTLVDQGVTTISRVLAANDVARSTDPGAPTVDLIGFQAASPNPFAVDSATGQPVDDQLNLIFAGDGDWFENTAPGEIPDFSIAFAFFEAEVQGFSSEGEKLFDERMFGDLISPTMTARILGDTVGDSEATPLMPSSSLTSTVAGQGEIFTFDLSDVDTDQIIWIDPDVAVGYIYNIIGADDIESITAPSFQEVPDTNGYTVAIDTPTATYSFAIAAGETILLAQEGITEDVLSFTLTGIDPSLEVDPNSTLAFKTGIGMRGAGPGTSVTQTVLMEFYDPPAVSPVPLPAAVWLLVASLGSLIALRRGRAA